MILTHLDSKDGKTLVRLPDGSTRWVDVHELIELAKSDLAERFQKAFPAAAFDESAREWRMVWKKGTYADWSIA